MLERIFLHQKEYSLRLRKEPISFRLEKLKRLEESLEKHTEDIAKALMADFGRPESETFLTEIYPVLKELQYVQKNLHRWARPEKANTPLLLWTSKSHIYREPRGVCLIIGPWNYPFQLMILPCI